MRFPSHLACAACVLAVLTAACASTSGLAAPRPFPSPGGSAPARPAQPGSVPVASVPSDAEPVASAPPAPVTPALPDVRAGVRDIIVDTALTFRGIPYRNGGSDPSGFDCSGFTQYVFALNGIALPRAVEEQFEVGQKIDAGDLASGDLVFFKTVSRGPSHVGIVIGGDQFIHAPSSRGVVRVERLSADYWSQRFIAARRVD